MRSCERSSRAIDVVLRRRTQNRSQFVFTKLKNGREATFWQTAATSRKARPRVTVPSDKTVSVLDTREVPVPFRQARHHHGPT